MVSYEELVLEKLYVQGALGFRQLIDKEKRLHQHRLKKILEDMVNKKKEVKCLTKDKEWKLGKKKVYTLTEKGKISAFRFIKEKGIRIALKNLPSREPQFALEALRTLFQSALELFWSSEKWDLDAAEKWGKLVKVIELSTREFINKDFPNKRLRFSDPYFTLREMNGKRLFRDALLACNLGHYLSPNHIDVLNKMGVVSSNEKFINQNRKWLESFKVGEYYDDQKAKQKLEEEENIRDKILGARPPNRPRYIRWIRDSIDSSLFVS